MNKRHTARLAGRAATICRLLQERTCLEHRIAILEGAMDNVYRRAEVLKAALRRTRKAARSIRRWWPPWPWRMRKRLRDTEERRRAERQRLKRDYDQRVVEERKRIEHLLDLIGRIVLFRDTDEHTLRFGCEVYLDPISVQTLMAGVDLHTQGYLVDRLAEGFRKILYTIDFAALPHIRQITQRTRFAVPEQFLVRPLPR
jgi:hypothetical protein